MEASTVQHSQDELIYEFFNQLLENLATSRSSSMLRNEPNLKLQVMLKSNELCFNFIVSE